MLREIYDGRSISRNVASLNILAHGVINLLINIEVTYENTFTYIFMEIKTGLINRFLCPIGGFLHSCQKKPTPLSPKKYPQKKSITCF